MSDHRARLALVKKFWVNRTHGPIKAFHPMTKKIIAVDPQRDARIGSDIDQELRHMPGLLSWWLALRDEAKERYREARHAEHNADEDLYAAERAKSPKATETVIKMAVKKTERMRRAYRARMDAQALYDRLESAVKVIEQKGFSLQALSKSASMERRTKDYA